MNVLQSYIIEAGSLFGSVIIMNGIPSLDIPVVKYSILLRSTKKRLYIIEETSLRDSLMLYY